MMPKPLRVCIWSSDTLDGQRQIWLLQTTYMNNSEYHFIWILDLSIQDNSNNMEEDKYRSKNKSKDRTKDSNTNNDHNEQKIHYKKHSIYDSLVLLPNVTIVNHPTLVVSVGM